MMNKIICIFLCLALFALPCSALSHSTYQALSQSNTNVQNLISLAVNYDNFAESDFVCYQNGQYSYYIVWGDLFVENDNVYSNSEVNYISYSRNDDYTYSYNSGIDRSFSLTVYDVFVSNIDGWGMRSSLYSEYEFQQNFVKFAIFGTGILFVILLTKLRKDK